MKKFALALVALLTMVFTGCKTETSTVTVNVEDTMGMPVGNRYVFYADIASVIISDIAPSPEELINGMSDCWEYVQTNNYGTVNINIELSVKSLKYYFLVFDLGTNKWQEKTVTLQRGVNDEITFVVNK